MAAITGARITAANITAANIMGARAITPPLRTLAVVTTVAAAITSAAAVSISVVVGTTAAAGITVAAEGTVAAAITVVADTAAAVTPISGSSTTSSCSAVLDNGLGFYRFSYNGSNKAYVGVMAQEVQAVMPEAVIRGTDGYLRVYYDRLGLRMQTWDEWVASGQKIPTTAPSQH